jgi:hypothetical protein
MPTRAEVYPVNGALSDLPFGVGWIGAEAGALDGALDDELLQLFPGAMATGVQFAVLAEAVLIGLGCVNTVEPVRRAADVEGVGVFTARRHGGE